MVENSLLAKFCIWIATLLPAILGAAISLRVSHEQAPFLTRLLSFLAGVAIAHIFGTATVDAFGVNLDTMIDEAIILAWGIFGMAAVTQIWIQMPDFIKGIRETITSWFGRK